MMGKATTYFVAYDTNTLYTIDVALYYDGKADYDGYSLSDLGTMDDDYWEDGVCICHKIQADNVHADHYVGTADWIESEIENFEENVRLANAGEYNPAINTIKDFAEYAALNRAAKQGFLGDNYVSSAYDITDEDWEEARKYHWAIEVKKTPLSV